MTTTNTSKSHRLNRELKASKLKSKKAQLENLLRKQERLKKEIQVLKSSIAKDTKAIAKESSAFIENMKTLEKIESEDEERKLSDILESYCLPSDHDLTILNSEKAKSLVFLESYLDPESSEDDTKILLVRLNQIDKDFQALSLILKEILDLLLKFE